MYKKTWGRAYPYAWLDEVVEVTLNPEKTNVIELEFQQLEIIAGQFDQELQSVLRDLKASTFYLISSKKIKATVTQYYDSLILLERQAMENLAAYPEDHPLATTGETIIFYIRNMGIVFKKRYGKYITETGADNSMTPAKRMVVSKLLCKLSADQIGIILKAADDTKTVLASSMSVIFRSVVPYLSTDKNKNLSWDSMRKSTYHIEQSDKEVAIATLEKLILKIKGY
ncbi:hypothetical protein [Mucilaginibacter rubeus]|uniref:hypothetical protein n=1 Tax=Mucilaginibacter rubeus TaxID=2027860 RepID=UPI0016669E57|nr:hypothetical protein [Mucilaginibacter rubeus]GGA95094.1 hypothetical protein GCM10011500_08630 [Mucilaginibacter rubeus]